MENLSEPKKNYAIQFDGKGGDFFGIVMVNWLLTIVTLGFYYPWAKAKKLQYLYNSTSLNNDSFAFHGTGKEMFKGFIKAIGFFIISVTAISVLFYFADIMQFIPITLYLIIIAVLPIAIHGSYRYRMSRSSWRGIRFGYRGDRKEFTILFFKWIGLTIITLGFYGPWMAMNMRNYLLGNVRMGDAEFNYEGDGTDYFMLNLKGYFLTLFTLGVYMFWWQRDLFAYYVDNLSLQKGKDSIQFNATATAGGFFKIIFSNLFLIIFTLGLGYAWAVMRTMNFVMSNIEAEGTLDLSSLTQTEENYKDATGEDVSDFLNLDTIM